MACGLEYIEKRKHCILCKNCMQGISCGRRPAWAVLGDGGGGGLLSVVPSQMSTVRGGLDLQRTGRRSLSSQRPTSLSATGAASEDLMFSLLRRRRGPAAFPSVYGRTLFSQHAKQSERVYLCRDLEQAQLHSGCKGVCRTGWRGGEALRARP